MMQNDLEAAQEIWYAVDVRGLANDPFRCTISAKIIGAAHRTEREAAFAIADRLEQDARRYHTGFNDREVPFELCEVAYCIALRNLIAAWRETQKEAG